MFRGYKDLLGISQLDKEGIETILNSAKDMKYVINQDIKRTNHLQGKSVVTLFCENSTRTRLSFESAVKYMGGMCSGISPSASSTQKGESLLDTVKTINMMRADAVIIRHSMSGTPEFLAKKHRRMHNKRRGRHARPPHPGAFGYVYDNGEKEGRIEGLKVAIIGDIAHSRVARSDINGLLKMGAEVTVGAPATLLPPDIERLGVKAFFVGARGYYRRGRGYRTSYSKRAAKKRSVPLGTGVCAVFRNGRAPHDPCRT